MQGRIGYYYVRSRTWPLLTSTGILKGSGDSPDTEYFAIIYIISYYTENLTNIVHFIEESFIDYSYGALSSVVGKISCVMIYPTIEMRYGRDYPRLWWERTEGK